MRRHKLTAIVAVTLSLLTQVLAVDYFMDKNEHCSFSGYQTIKTGGTVNVYARATDGTGTPALLTCTLRFEAAEKGTELRLEFKYVSINTPAVTLYTYAAGATNAEETLTAGSPTPQTKVATSGNVILRVDKRSISDRDYDYHLVITAFKPNQDYGATDSNPIAVGLVVGIVGGIVGFLLVLAIIGVCCYKKIKKAQREHEEMDYKENLEEAELSGVSYGYTNTVNQNGGLTADEYHDSPRGKKKLLANQSHYRDDYNASKERAPPSPPVVSAYNSSPKKSTTFDYQDVEFPQEHQEKEPEPEVPKSPILAALHSNPKFRATFQATEAEAEQRAQRFSTHSESESQSSVNSFTALRRDRSESSPSKPVLPSVPIAPKSPALKRQNHASIRRAMRPSSSSEEVAYLTRNPDDYDDPHIQVIHDNSPPSPSEVVPIKVQDPHTTEPQGKSSTQHTLRPQRRRSPQEKRRAAEGSKPKEETLTARGRERDRPLVQSTSQAPEGMFKKANSLRKRSQKSPRLGRQSRSSVGNALDDTESLRPDTPTSMVSRGDDFDSYAPLRRTDSRQSLYASRSSLYGRRGKRERRGSFTESVSTYAHDDIDAYRHRYNDYDYRPMSRQDRFRGSKSLGDLEYEMRERSTQTLRETATQTGQQATISSQPKRATRKKSVPRNVSTSEAQTETPKKTKVNKTGTKAEKPEATGKKEAAKADKTDAETAEKPSKPTTPKTKPKPKPKPKPRPVTRKSQSAGLNSTDDEIEADDKENPAVAAPAVVNGYNNSSDSNPPTSVPHPANSVTAPQQTVPMDQLQQPATGTLPPQAVPLIGSQPTNLAYAPQFYVSTPQGMVLAQPVPQMQPVYPGGMPQTMPSVSNGASQPENVVVPTVLPNSRPSKSNWELLCEMTSGPRSGRPTEMGSVTGSVFSVPPPQPQLGPGYQNSAPYAPSLPISGAMTAALSDHGSYSYEPKQRTSSGPSSGHSSHHSSPLPQAPSFQPPPPENLTKKSSWEALKGITDSPYKLTYGASQNTERTESIV